MVTSSIHGQRQRCRHVHYRHLPHASMSTQSFATYLSSSSSSSSLQRSLLLIVVSILCQLPRSIHCQSSLTWEKSNDPDFLCANADGSSKFTGYKATLDCRGYVYCSDGYLMGGGSASSETSTSSASNGSSSTTSGVIACMPNQLFDEALGTCTYWQNVDTSSCPEYDSTKMMPELTDENANQERFFVSHLIRF